MAARAKLTVAVKTVIKVQDMVQVINGRNGGRITPPKDSERANARSQGRRGVVREVNREKCTLIVDGVNIVHKHERANPQKNHRGGRVDKEAPVAISSVRLVCPECDAAVRVRNGRDDKGYPVRVCVKCKATF
jgi:large subunit ribosomal protein L24